MKHQKLIRPVLAGLSIALVSGAALAYGGGANGHSPKMGQGGCDGKAAHGFHGHKQGNGMMRFPSSLIEQLNLTDAQKVALFDAQTATKAMRDSMRESMRTTREQGKEAAESGTFDPREMFKRQDERMARMQQARQSIQQQWLGFWDALSAEQKAIVQAYVQSKVKDSKRG